MKKNKWLTSSIVLALAMIMLWAVPGTAQMRGKGQGGQGWGCGQGQGQGTGYGAGNSTSPNNQGYQNCRGNWNNKPQANLTRRGPRGGGRTTQPNTQPSAPPVTQ